MKTRALVKIYSGMILLGINFSYLLWINYFLKILDSSSQWNLIDYDGPMQSALEGLYLPEEVWPLHAILLALGLFGAISLLAGILEYIGAIFEKEKHMIKRNQTKSEASKSQTTNASHESCNSIHRRDAVFMSDIISRVPLLLRSSDDTNERKEEDV